MARKKKPGKPGPNNPIKHLVGHRFGEPGGANPDQSKTQNKPWSLRHAIRRIAAHEFDIGPGAKPLTDQIKKIWKPDKATGAQMAAAIKWGQAMKNYKAMENLTIDIDGKHTEKAEVTVGYADLVLGSMEDERNGTFVTGDDEEGS